MRQITYQDVSPYIGMDPELFLKDENGNIVPSHEFVPEKGMDTETYYSTGKNTQVVRDGVQIEIHPKPHQCRANLGNELAAIVRGLIDHVRRKGLKLDFTQTIEIPKGQFRKIPTEVKQLGCMPSLNAYKKNAKIRVNPVTYRKRSAGGHLHFGIAHFKLMKDEEQVKKLVKVLDLGLANTCVMIDRDPQAAIRRRNYGRAGEYRTPKHGLEYRVLSNFWLRDYRLMSFVTGLARLWIDVVYQSSQLKNDDLVRDLFEGVDFKKVAQAINKNDLDLAKENWALVREFIKTHVPYNLEGGLCRDLLPNFDIFLKKIEEKGLDFWFPLDKVEEQWLRYTEGHGTGWETFLNYTVPTRKDK